MLGYLPPYYQESSVMRGLLEAWGGELDLVRAALEAVLEEWFARSATWTLDRWEDELGLAPAPLGDEGRRERILARLRAGRTATPGVVASVAAAFANGEIALIEDFPGYRVIVRFMSETGIPARLGEVQAALRELVPAHLEIAYEFNWLLWLELNVLKGLDLGEVPPVQAYTWAELETLTADGLLTWGELERYR
jgi:hypothetical protein